MAVTSLHEKRGEVIPEHVEPHSVNSGVPDACQFRVAAREAAFVIRGFGLADQPDCRDLPWFVKIADVNPTEANALIQLRVQFQTVGIAMFDGLEGFHRMLRTVIHDGRLVVFADAHLDVA